MTSRSQHLKTFMACSCYSDRRLYTVDTNISEATNFDATRNYRMSFQCFCISFIEVKETEEDSQEPTVVELRARDDHPKFYHFRQSNSTFSFNSANLSPHGTPASWKFLLFHKCFHSLISFLNLHHVHSCVHYA